MAESGLNEDAGRFSVLDVDVVGPLDFNGFFCVPCDEIPDREGDCLGECKLPPGQEKRRVKDNAQRDVLPVRRFPGTANLSSSCSLVDSGYDSSFAWFAF